MEWRFELQFLEFLPAVISLKPTCLYKKKSTIEFECIHTSLQNHLQSKWKCSYTYKLFMGFYVADIGKKSDATMIF